MALSLFTSTNGFMGLLAAYEDGRVALFCSSEESPSAKFRLAWWSKVHTEPVMAVTVGPGDHGRKVGFSVGADHRVGKYELDQDQNSDQDEPEEIVSVFPVLFFCVPYQCSRSTAVPCAG